MTATPATIAPRMGMLGGVLQRGAGARIGTDEDLHPAVAREVLAERRLTDEARALTAEAWASRADLVQQVNELREVLARTHQQNEAYRAELAVMGPVVEMARAVAHGHRGVEDLRQAWIEAGL